MQMTESEICVSYRQAKNKNEQVRILAQLNAVSAEEILGILSENGYISGVPNAKKAGEKAVSAEEEKTVKKREKPEIVLERYIGLADKGFTLSEAAEAMGLSVSSVCKYAKKHGIRFVDMRKKKKAVPTAGTVETAKAKEKIVLSKDNTICEEKQVKSGAAGDLLEAARKSVLEMVSGGQVISAAAAEKTVILTVRLGEDMYSVKAEGL